MINFKDISWYGFGYTDVCSEWCSTGGGYTYVSRGGEHGLNHNYYVSWRGSKSKWWINISQSLRACNSQDIPVFSCEYKTKKSMLSSVWNIIEEYDKSVQCEIKMEEWKHRNAKPVFIKKDGKVELVGTIYRWSVIDDSDALSQNKLNYLYYNDDMPKESSYKYYILEWWNDKVFIDKEESFGGGHCSGGMKDDNMLKEMLNIVKGNPKYEFINELADKQFEKEKVMA